MATSGNPPIAEDAVYDRILRNPDEVDPKGAAGERGQTLPIIIAFMLVLLLFAGFVIDIGNAWRAQAALQASTDASATAAAGTLTLTYPPNTANAQNQAYRYGDQPGQLNPVTGIIPGSATQSVQMSCKVQAHFLCTYDNTVDVNQSVSVPTYFLGLIGINSIKVSSHSEACSPCGEVPLDIQLVIDRTGSMNETGGSTNGETKEWNLKQGLLNGFLTGLDPTVDYVGLTLLPPDNNGTSDVCQAQSQASYDNPGATYTVVPLSNSYMNSTTGQLVPGSPLVSDIKCLQAGGSTDYANALEAADAELVKDGRPGVQKVIVLLSDGAANTGQNCRRGTTDPHCTQPCHTAVNDADSYKTGPDHVLIYTILYGDQTGGPACQDWRGNNESPFMQPWTAMQQIASAGNYYPDPNPANLTTVFQQISADMAAGTSRIVE